MIIIEKRVGGRMEYLRKKCFRKWSVFSYMSMRFPLISSSVCQMAPFAFSVFMILQSNFCQLAAHTFLLYINTNGDTLCHHDSTVTIFETAQLRGLEY